MRLGSPWRGQKEGVWGEGRSWSPPADCEPRCTWQTGCSPAPHYYTLAEDKKCKLQPPPGDRRGRKSEVGRNSKARAKRQPSDQVTMQRE